MSPHQDLKGHPQSPNRRPIEVAVNGWAFVALILALLAACSWGGYVYGRETLAVEMLHKLTTIAYPQ